MQPLTVNLGTLRTRWTDQNELPFPDMTPVEMARALGFSGLSEILSPVIRHNIPARTLNTLESNFHDIIRGDLGDSVTKTHLRLPELIVLTELKVPFMQFLLHSADGIKLKVVLSLVDSNGRNKLIMLQGYYYLLDGRELLVKSFGTHESGRSQQYRISEKGVIQIEEAVVFNPRQDWD
jgi:hypothetical protein